MLLKRFCVFQS